MEVVLLQSGTAEPGGSGGGDGGSGYNPPTPAPVL